MDITRRVNFVNREEWRNWLKENHTKEKEIWLIYPKKASGKPRIPYNNAVEEALCFGWIDSTAKRIDENSYAQRFTPLNPKTSYSETNKQRLRKLVAEGKVIPSVEKSIKDWLNEEFKPPNDIIDKIKTNKEAWTNFQNFSNSYKRIRIGYIEIARNRPEEFRRRLNHFVAMTAQNKQFGFGGIEEHY
jgi:uncharacterized protein YdeI (YjbR/CyaY-like superfamily)